MFDDMLIRSIPQYEVMRKAVFDLACLYQKENTAIIDMGCSRGEAISELIKKYGAHNNYIGIEISEPMIRAAKKRFQGLITQNIVKIENLDLRNDFPKIPASIILSILTLQFTPIEYRKRILKNVYTDLISGGCFILVEKLIGESDKVNENFVSLYYNLKKENGYSQEQIERKKLSLEGVLVPVTAKWNIELLQETGFKQIDCFWRWMNFAGFIAIK